MKLTELKPSELDLLESIYAAQSDLKITTQHDRAASTPEAISTFFKKIPYQTRLRGSDPIYSVLNYISNDETTKLLTSLKGKGPYVVNEKQLDTLLNQIVGACKKIINDVDPEVIIFPKSSSELLKKFVDKLTAAYPSIKVVDEGFVKKVLAAGDEEALINKQHPDWEKFASEHPDAADELKKSLKRHIKDGNLEVKKLYKPYAKFIKNFIQMKDASNTLDQVIGKRVLVVDDVLSSGSTMLEMFRQLKEFEPEVISGLTIFKRTSEAH